MNTWMLLERTELLLPNLYRQARVPELSVLFEGTELAPYSEQSPILVIGDECPDLLRIVRQSPEQWPGLIVQSEHSTGDLLAHLRQILFIRFDGERKGVLRYSSPVTASYFFPACQSDTLKFWLGPISNLSWYGGTWADKALSGCAWHTLENPHSKNWKELACEPVLDSAQQLALRCQQQDHFLYLWWLKQDDLCYSRGQQWLHEGLQLGFKKADWLERYLNVRLDYPEPELPSASPDGSDENRFAFLLHHLQKLSTGQES